MADRLVLQLLCRSSSKEESWWSLVDAQPCTELQTGAGACLQLQTGFIPMLLFLPCHGEATLTLISPGLQLTEAESRCFSVYVVTVELVKEF